MIVDYFAVSQPSFCCLIRWRINAVGTKFSSVLSIAVPVTGQIPVLRRGDGSSPQGSCRLSLVFPSFIVSQVPSSRWALNSFQSGKTFRHIRSPLVIYIVIECYTFQQTMNKGLGKYGSKWMLLVRIMGQQLIAHIRNTTLKPNVSKLTPVTR